MSKDLRIEALSFAMSDFDCNTVATSLGKAAEIFGFLNECPGERELRLQALTAASTVAMRWTDDCPDVSLISDARAFLDFLKATSSVSSLVPVTLRDLIRMQTASEDLKTADLCLREKSSQSELTTGQTAESPLDLGCLQGLPKDLQSWLIAVADRLKAARK